MEIAATSRNSTTPSPVFNNPRPLKRLKSAQNSENDSSSAEAETGGNESMVDTEGECSSESTILNEIELVFKPHPTEMTEDNSLIKALRENSIRYIKTTANATGRVNLQEVDSFIYSYLSSKILCTSSFFFDTMILLFTNFSCDLGYYY